MNNDESTTKDLLQVLEDGKEGYAKGAKKLADSDRPEFATTFRTLGEQRAVFASELQTLAATYGDAIEEHGTIAGTLHRGWMAMKDALSGDDPSGVLDAAEQGEDHAVAAYEKALGEELSLELRSVVERQASEIRKAHDQVKSLRNATS